jgi:5-methylcytosine-specific restriction endonuclease McrA
MYDAYWLVCSLPSVTSEIVSDAQEARAAAGRFVAKYSYPAYLRSEEWQTKRSEALARCAHKCQLCSGTRALNVHHNTYESVGCEAPSDLIVLCSECHTKHHSMA